MPLVNINLIEGKPESYLQAVRDTLHQALMETWGIPEHDRFHIVHERKAEHFLIDREMFDVQRSDDVIVFQLITSPRTRKMKKAFFERLPELLHEKVGVRPEDVFISLVMNTEEDWSFGHGKMQLEEES